MKHYIQMQFERDCAIFFLLFSSLCLREFPYEQKELTEYVRSYGKRKLVATLTYFFYVRQENEWTFF